jgi:hypothetical protein
MPVEARLEIVWDGDAQGLPARRLSVDAFGAAIRALLAAIRRIGTSQEREAGAGVRGGRFSKEAAGLDVQIESLTTNSPVHLACWVVQVGESPLPLIADLPHRAASTFVEAVRSESSGQPYFAAVRRFLAALPPGVSHQRYAYRSPAGVNQVAEVGTMSLPETKALPYLLEVEGQVVGVGFEPGEPSVRLLSGRQRFSGHAEPRHIDEAIALPD